MRERAKPSNPGSHEASLRGCICSRAANHHGIVVPTGGWRIDPECAVHRQPIITVDLPREDDAWDSR